MLLFLACATLETPCERACDLVWTTCAPEVQPEDGAWGDLPDEMPDVAASCKEECAIEDAPADEWADCVLESEDAAPDEWACWDAYECGTHPCTEAETRLYTYADLNGSPEGYDCNP